MIAGDGPARLLPWAGTGGKPCYLVGDGTGYLSRVADTVECVQLGMAGELLDHARDLLDEPGATAHQLRYLATRLTEALRDVHRIAESRGARLPRPPYEEGEDAPCPPARDEIHPL